MKVYLSFDWLLPRAILLYLTLTPFSNALMWIQPGMNHIVACCDVISFNATKLEVENNRLHHKNIILNETSLPDLGDFQPPKLESTTLSLPSGAAVLPLVSSLHFQPHHWYNVCFKRKSDGEDDRSPPQSVCFPVRPCGCDCDERTDESPWLRVLVNASIKGETIHLRLLSTFSPDTLYPLRVRYNLVLQSEKYYELCNKLEAPSGVGEDEGEEEEKQYQMRKRQCKREPIPIEAHQINPSEAFQIHKKQVGGLPFYLLITINLTESGKYWGREIVHKLDPIKVEEEDEGMFGQWISVPVPTPRMEEEHRPILDWDEDDAKRICPLIHKVDCTKSSSCSGAGSRISFCVFSVLFMLGLHSLVRL